MADPRGELFELRQQAHFYRAQHARACEREALLKEKVAQLEDVVRAQERTNSALREVLEALEAKVAWLTRQLFGDKSEKSPTEEGTGKAGANQEAAEKEHSKPDGPADGKKRGRGQQPGTRSSGRTRHTELPIEEIVVDVPELERLCPECGLPAKTTCGTADSEVVHIEIKVVRKVYKRKRYGRQCHCTGTPRIVTAPAPAKLFPKGKYSTGFWAWILEQKYLFQVPMHRALQMLELHGLDVSQGTVTDNLKRIGELVQPLYACILERARSAKHWHMDETRWKVFEEFAGKIGHRWWLWVVVTHDTCVYLLDPTRSSDVPKNFLGENPEGIISADRYSAYKCLLSDLLAIAFCWVHVRRDFCRIRDGYPKLRRWATAWIERIDTLFHCNSERINARADPEGFSEHDEQLRARMAAIEQAYDEELAGEHLHAAARKALQSMKNHWKGLTIFVDNPDIPMDNNRAERGIRGPAIGRKNYYGSGSVWSGTFSVMMFTLFQTLLLNNVNPHDFLLAYLDACAKNKGHPPEDLDAFLPWNFEEEQKKAA